MIELNQGGIFHPPVYQFNFSINAIVKLIIAAIRFTMQSRIDILFSLIESFISSIARRCISTDSLFIYFWPSSAADEGLYCCEQLPAREGILFVSFKYSLSQFMGYLKEKGIIILCIMQILCADCYGGIIDRPFVRITFALYLGVNINVYLCKNRSDLRRR